MANATEGPNMNPRASIPAKTKNKRGKNEEERKGRVQELYIPKKKDLRNEIIQRKRKRKPGSIPTEKEKNEGTRMWFLK